MLVKTIMLKTQFVAILAIFGLFSVILINPSHSQAQENIPNCSVLLQNLQAIGYVSNINYVTSQLGSAFEIQNASYLVCSSNTGTINIEYCETSDFVIDFENNTCIRMNKC